MSLFSIERIRWISYGSFVLTMKCFVAMYNSFCILFCMLRHQVLFIILTLSWRRPFLYRNQSIDLLCKSMDWFLYDNALRHERVNEIIWHNHLKNIEHSPAGNCMFKVNNRNTATRYGVVLVSLLLTLNIFHTLP